MFRLATAVATALLAAGPLHAQTTTLQLSNEYEATSLHAEGDMRFADRVRELTGGSVEIVVHTDAALGYRSADHLAAVGSGDIALADTFGGALGDLDPAFLVSSLPYVAPTPDAARRLYATVRDTIEGRFAAHGQLLLYASPWPPSGIWARTPVTSREDVGGLRIRTYDRSSTEVFTFLGASPAELSWTDVPDAIAAGDVDAVLTSTESGINGALWSAFGHFSEIGGYAIPLNFVHMNRAAFDALSADEREAILTAAAETEEVNWAALASRMAADDAKLAAEGVAIDVPQDAAWLESLREAGSSVVDLWLTDAGPSAQHALEAFRANAQ